MIRRPAWLDRTVATLSAGSLLNDAASEMVTPLAPLFLVTVLGAPAAAYGGIEGAADALSALMKLWSGRRADRVGSYRGLTIAGYTLSNLARPGWALVGGPVGALVLRLVDRAGKGLRTSPRDAMLAAAAAPEHRASVFSFHRGADHAGAFCGAGMAWVAVVATGGDLRAVFAWSALPGAVLLAVLLAFLREPTAPASRAGTPTGLAAPVAPALRWLLVAVGLFGLGNLAEGFLVLKAGVERVPLAGIPLLWMALHAVKVGASWVGGPMADRLGRRRLVAAGWGWHAAVYVGLAVAHGTAALTALVLAHGVYAGLAEGAERALVADLARESGRGGAFGGYHLVAGGAALAGGLGLGVLWDAVGPGAAFGVGAALSVLAMLPLAISSRVGQR